MELPEELCQLAETEEGESHRRLLNEDGLLTKPATEFNREKQSAEG